jgi:hypothetical protein
MHAILELRSKIFGMGYLGLEPRTYRLKAEYSTIELATRYIAIFYRPTLIIHYLKTFYKTY